MKIEIKCTMNVKCLNHPETTPTSMKLVLGAKKVGDCCLDDSLPCHLGAAEVKC